ncbi:hypothetical protein [Maritimibacter fusiformis]|uniref:Uncharacterized protein n=1 Tax=Maritimibacter fusiformis TaxID=2603819 RepID=A0A5D0RGB6_9RHOB|nr:hypothetical protein [Maritimibacter fusiformis]TYB80562.1 hypothetical protein FVF75_13065 [Maritimibacter fusiformis]
MTYGKLNITGGLLFLAAFMAYGFLLIYLRDFAPSKEQWIADYGIGTHFEARLAHVHGNLFALLNVLIGYLVWKLPIDQMSAKWVSWLAFAGMLMPIGIVAEIVLGVPPYLVLLGAILIVVAMAWLGIAVWRAKLSPA